MEEEYPLDAAQGCITGCLITVPFWVILIVILALISMSCGVVTTLPTSEPVSNVMVKSVNSPAPTATEVHVELPTGCGVKPEFTVPLLVHTLGKLNVRECPSTSSPVIGVLDDGAEIDVGEVVEIADTGYNCNRWRPIAWNGKAAWVCQDWLSK